MSKTNVGAARGNAAPVGGGGGGIRRSARTASLQRQAHPCTAELIGNSRMPSSDTQTAGDLHQSLQ